MKTIVKTKTQAIEEAKQELRDSLNKKRLPNVRISTISCQCDCGETPAIMVESLVKLPAKYSYSMQSGKKILKEKEKTTLEFSVVGYCFCCGK